MTTATHTATPKVCTPPTASWHADDRQFYVDMIDIPRSLALDLVRCLGLSTFIAESSDEDCEAGLHEIRFNAHCKRMDSLEDVVNSELIEQGIPTTPENILRVLAITYEGAALVGKDGAQ